MSKVKKIKQTDGSVVTITTADEHEYICDGYNAEDDITKSHDEIVCKVAEIDLELEEILRKE